MSALDARTIQRILISVSCDLGEARADGVIGRLTTAAITAFQTSRGPKIEWPGTIGPMTQAAIVAASGDPSRRPMVLPWMEEAKRRLGFKECEDSAALRARLKSDGASVGDPAKLPWCGDFVETAIALTLPHEPLPSNPYLARNWLTFGRLVASAPGAVLVFWRGARTCIEGAHRLLPAREQGSVPDPRRQPAQPDLGDLERQGSPA
jgi:peptidoglycan hydrolase-like protein with peptidoglycan-binding domain